MPDRATQSIGAGLWGILIEILFYGIGGLCAKHNRARNMKLAGPTGNHWIICKQNIDNNRSYGFYVNNAYRTITHSIHTTFGHFESAGGAVLEYGLWYHVAVVYNWFRDCWLPEKRKR